MEAVLEVFRLGLQDQERYARLVTPPEDDGFYDREWREHEEGIVRNMDDWWVADDRSEVVGFIWMQYPMDELGPYATVREVDVHPEHRNKGIGTLLLKHAEELSRSTDAVMLLISGFITNPAIRLYRRLGFTDFPDCYKHDKNPNHVVLWKPFRADLMKMNMSEQQSPADR
jgi:GNAT superfamily N-acetyltransferase